VFFQGHELGKQVIVDLGAQNNVATSARTGLGKTMSDSDLHVYDMDGAVVTIEGGSRGSPSKRAMLELVSDTDYLARGVIMDAGDDAPWFVGVPYKGNALTVARDRTAPWYRETAFMLVTEQGRVGIGTRTPSELLHVAGNVQAEGGGFMSHERLDPTTSRGLCTSSRRGEVFYHDYSNTLCLCDGTSWTKIPGGGACTPICGNGSGPEPGEYGDEGAGNGTGEGRCLTDCSGLQTCGNGALEGTEECDDDNTTADDGCNASCMLEFCGDNVTQGGLDEECDDGNSESNDGCSANCVVELCGDGITQDGLEEQCDDGNQITGDGCESCICTNTCGDGIWETCEACDDGNAFNTDFCLDNCQHASCGDGFVWTGVEQCDDGESNSDVAPDACRTNCTNPYCGDGVIDSGESCDPPGPNCDADCQIIP